MNARGGRMSVRRTVVIILCLSLFSCASSQRKLEKNREKDPRYQCNVGLVYLNNGQIDLAVPYFQKSLLLDPDYDLALSSLGIAYTMRRDFQDAEKYFRKALQVNPGLTEVHNYLGTIYLEMGDIDKAESEYRRALQDESYQSKELPLYNLAKLYMEQGQLREARRLVDQALNHNISLTMAWDLKAKIFEKEDDYPQAILSYKRALKTSPANNNLNLDLAIAYFNNGDLSQAKRILQQLKTTPLEPEFEERVDHYLDRIK